MKRQFTDDAPAGATAPLFGSWGKAYAVVALAFAIEVALFYTLGRCFA